MGERPRTTLARRGLSVVIEAKLIAARVLRLVCSDLATCEMTTRRAVGAARVCRPMGATRDTDAAVDAPTSAGYD